MDIPAIAEHVVAIAGSVVTAASLILAIFPPPVDPKTPLGHIIRLIEMAGLAVGYARRAGVMPKAAAVDQIADQAVEFARAVKADATVPAAPPAADPADHSADALNATELPQLKGQP